MNNLTNDSTLEEAKEFLRKNWNKGEPCPCCTQNVKLYRRKITSSMAYALILINKYFKANPGMQTVHISDHLNSLEIPGAVRNTGDITKLRYWNLIEEDLRVREDGSKRAGYWKITELGREFAEGKVAVQSHAKVFNAKCYGLEGEPISIQDALGNKFNYDELMQS